MPPANKKNETVRDSTINVTVGFLDEHVESFKVPGRCLGQRLYDLVIGKLGSFEYQYFDLAFLDVEGNHCWLDHKKSLLKALRSSGQASLEFVFSVKYYVSHPNLIGDEHTRYLFALQLKRDFFNGLLHSNRNTSLLLAAFIVQSELGDYMETECKSYAYLKKHHLLRSAPDSYLMRVMELHQTLVGLTKEEADYRLLDAARKVELYGVRLHPVKDAADQPFNLAVTHAGVLVFQQFSRVNTFMWSKIRKLSFNRHKFLIKLHTGDQSYLRDTVEYTFPTRNSCKNFWRKCIEQHAFFRSVTSLFPVNGSTGRSVGLLDSFRSGSLSSVRRLRRSASCGATEQIDSLHSSVSRTSDRPTSSGQVSQMSTPVRRFARIRQHTASLKLFNKQQKRILDELQSPCLLSETKPAWALPEHPYTLPKQSTPGCKPVGVAKLLSNCPNPTAEYFQLLRLSFTSLIPESVSALDSGHTTPAASSRMRTLERMRERAVSTPSIHQPDVPKRKRSCHAFVPRQFNPLGSGTLPGARLKSQTSDDTLDLSASRTFPKRPDLDEVANCLQQRDKIGGNHIANGTSPPSLTASTEVYRVNGYHLHRTPSSSCSLASDMSPTPLSENETTLNDICGFVSPRDPRGSWLDGCGENEDAWSVSSREPVLSNLAPPNTSAEVYSPQVSFLSIPDETARFEFQSVLDAITPHSSVVDVHEADEPGASRISALKSVVIDAASHPTSDYDSVVQLELKDPCTEATLPEHSEPLSIESKVVERCDSVAPQSDDHHPHSIDDLFLGEPREEDSVHELTVVQPTTSSSAIYEGPHIPEPLDGKCESRSEPDGVYFSDSESHETSRHRGHGDELPESLVDAVSLGAISMITGISCYDELPDDERSTDSEVDHQSNSKSDSVGLRSRTRLTGCTSLKLLGRSYWGPSTTSTSSSSLSPPGPNAANIPDADRRGNRGRAFVQRTKSDPEVAPRRSKRHKKANTNRKPLHPGEVMGSPDKDVAAEKQRLAELRSRQHFLRQAIQSEEIYQRDLHFLATVPLDFAGESENAALMEWLEQRLLPLLSPLVERHSGLLTRLRSELERCEKLTQSSPKRIVVPGNFNPLSKPDQAESGDILADIFDASLARAEPGETVESESDNLISINQPVAISAAGDGNSGTSGSSTYSVLQVDHDSRRNSMVESDHRRSMNAAQTDNGGGLASFNAIFASYLDLLEPYTAWITDSSTLIAELWYLAYSDLLTGPIPNSSIPNPVLEHEGIEEPHSGRSPTPKNHFSSSSRCMSRTRSESAVDQSFPLSVPTATCMVPSIVDPVAIRAIWYRIESHHSCLTPLPVYLLRPGRHFRQYCVLFGSLLTKYTPSHPDLIACKAVFTRFVQLARSVYTAYHHAEQIVFILQCARSVLPMFGFLGLLPLTPGQSNSVGTAGETDIPVPRRNALSSPSNPKSNNLTVWPSVTSPVAFRSHLRRMPYLHRVGWLKKYSRRGFQPRMVFLFDDRIVFTSRIRGTRLFLKIHGIISLNCAYVVKEHLNIPGTDQLTANTDDISSFAVVAVVDIVDEATTHLSGLSCDSPRSRSRSATAAPRKSLPSRSRSKSCARRKLRRKLLFCAADEASRDAWVANISHLIGRSLETGESAAPDNNAIAKKLELKLPAGVFRFRDPDLSEWVRNELVQHQPGTHSSSQAGSSLSVRLVQSRKHPAEKVPGCLTDGLLTVCWHRHLGITHSQLLNANDCEVSSFLLRKFKHGKGWQKLWAVLSELSLLFYKTPEDLQPLARLALLGYTVELVDNVPPLPSSNVPISCSSGKRFGSSKLSHSIIQLSHGSKQYQLRAETQEILMSWYHVFSAILTEAQYAKQPSTNKQLADFPVCIPRTLWSCCGSAELVYTCNSSVLHRGRCRASEIS